MSTVAVSTDSEKSKFSLRSSFRKPKHKGGGGAEKDEVEDVGLEELLVMPVMTTKPIYCYRDENDKLIRTREYGRVNFSEKPVEIGLAAPRTFSRNYTRSKNKKKSNKHQDSQEGHQLMKLFQSPEVLGRLDTVTNEELHDLITSPPAIMSPDSMDSGIGTLSPEIPAEGPSKPKKPLMSDPNMVDLEAPSTPLKPTTEPVRVPEQIKLSFFRPPIAGTWVPPVPKKDEAPRSDGESEADDEDDDSEENVYFVDQAERDEEALNILSNLDNDDDGFFNDILLVETNIDEVVKREVKETCIDSAPILLNSNIGDLVKETSLCEGPSAEPELSPVKEAVVDHESEGSVDSGVEAGTDSPSDEASPSEELVPTLEPADDVEQLEISPPTSPGGNELCYLQYNEEPSRPKSALLDSETSSDESEVPDIPERPASPYTPAAVVAVVSSPQRSPRIPQKFLSPPSSPGIATSPKFSSSNSLQRPSPRNSPLSSPSKPRHQPNSMPHSPARADAILGQVYIPIEPTFHLPASSSEEDQVVIPRTSLSAVATTPSPTSPSKPTIRSASPPKPRPASPCKPTIRSASPLPSEEKVEPRSGSFSNTVPTLAAKRALEQAARTPPPTRALPAEPQSPPLPPKQTASPVKAQRTPPIEHKQARIVTQTPVEPKTIPQMVPMSKPLPPAMIPLSRPPPPAPIPQQTQTAKRPPPLDLKPQTPPVARRPPFQKVETPPVVRRPPPIEPKVEIPPIHRRAPPAQPKVETPPIVRRHPPVQPKSESPISCRPVTAAPKSETPPITRRPIITPSPQTPPPPLLPQQMSTPPPLEEQRLPTPPTPIATPPTTAKGGQMIYPDRTPVEAWKPPPPMLPVVFPAPPAGGMSDFDDIDNLLMDLLENDPLIARQELIRKNEIEQQRSAYEEKTRREAAERLAVEAAIRHARDQELAQIQAVQRAEEEKEKKVQDELEARREKKRQMREMSLDDILKMSKNKPKRSPTLSIRSEASGSIRRASSESLNKDEVEGKNKKKLSASSSSQSMIAPLSMLDELLDPPMMFAQPISSASPNNSSAGVFITSTITRNATAQQQAPPPKPPRASPAAVLRGVPEAVPETLTVRDGPVYELPTPGSESDTISPNAAVSQAQSNAVPAVTVQTKPAEPIKDPMDDWGDLDDLLKDVECMASDLATDLSEKIKRRNSSDQSLNSIGSSSPKPIYTQSGPPLPPRPTAPLPPRQFQLQPQIPENGPSAFSPPPSAFSPPPSAFSHPARTFSPSRLSDTSSINSQCSDSYVYNAARASRTSERQQSPSSVSDFRFQRSNTLPHNYNRGSSAFQEPSASDHTRSFRRKSSIDDLQKRTDELRLQKSYSQEQPQRGPIQPQYPEQREVVQWDQMARAQAPSLAPVSPQYHPGYAPPQQYHPSAQYHPHHDPPARRDNSREFNHYPRDQYNPTSRDHYNSSNRGYDPRHDPRTSQRHEAAPRGYYEQANQQYDQPPRGPYVQHELPRAQYNEQPRGQYNEQPRGHYEPPRERTDSSNSGQRVILNNNHHTMV